MSRPSSPLLSRSQLAALAEIGEERSAAVGERLYGVGDRTYPFVAILEGEVAILDARETSSCGTAPRASSAS
jgi:hypothetical protein